MAAGLLLPDLAFGAVQQALNIGAVHDPEKNAEPKEQRRRAGFAEAEGAIYSYRVGTRICVPKVAIRRLLAGGAEEPLVTTDADSRRG